MKKIISVLMAAAMLLMASACENTNNMAELVKSNIEDIADEITGRGEEVQPQENSINIGIADFDTFNPLLTSSQTVREAMQFIYEPLFEVDEAMRIVPVLASGYSMSADGLTYNITMKSDVLWHNGRRFDAYDAAYTIKQILNNPTPYSDNLKDMADYRALSDDTLRIVLKKPVMQFAALLSFPIIQYQTEMKVNPSYKPVGTGAFEFKGKVGIDKYVLSSFDLYHNGKSKIENVYIYSAPDSEKLKSMLEVSETDAASGSSLDLTSYMPKGKSRLNDFVSNKMTFAGFNLKSSMLEGADTRAGIAELIDKEEIVDAVLYSRGVASDIPINPYSWLYYDTNTDFGADRDKALELLGNDGWGFNEDGYLQRSINGRIERLRLVILVNSDNAIKMSIAASIKNNLERCGITVLTDGRPYAEYIKKAENHDFDIIIGEYDLGINQDITPLVSSVGNYFGYANAEADMLIAQAGMTQDEETLKDVYRQMGELIRKDAPFAPLYYAKESVLISGKIKSGVTPSVSGVYRVSNIWSVFE